VSLRDYLKCHNYTILTQVEMLRCQFTLAWWRCHVAALYNVKTASESDGIHPADGAT